MKCIAVLILASLAVGCHSQQQSNPTVNTCKVASGGVYVTLNIAAPSTGLSYTDTHPAAGAYCYVAQSVVSTTGQISDPSNIAGPFVLSGANSTQLSWTAPASGTAPTGYIISRAPAASSTLLAPSITNGQVAQTVQPALPAPLHAKPKYLASIEAPTLTAVVR